MYQNGDKHIQNFHLEKYIFEYTVRNHILRYHSHVHAQLNFQPYIQQYTSPNEKFEYFSYPKNTYHCALKNVDPSTRLTLSAHWEIFHAFCLVIFFQNNFEKFFK